MNHKRETPKVRRFFVKSSNVQRSFPLYTYQLACSTVCFGASVSAREPVVVASWDNASLYDARASDSALRVSSFADVARRDLAASTSAFAVVAARTLASSSDLDIPA